MADTRSFARDWQLLKLSRDWKPADRSGEILNRLIQDHDTSVIQKIEKIVADIGKKDAEEILRRMNSMMEMSTILEGVLLVSGMIYETEKENGMKKIMIKKEMKSCFSEGISDSGISAVYVKSFIEALVPDIEITDKGDHFTLFIK